jgi:hypothetical protein
MNNSPKRRWFQLSLTTLFVLTFGAAMFFAGYGLARRQAERELRRAREQAKVELVAEQEEAFAKSIEQAELSWKPRVLIKGP